MRLMDLTILLSALFFMAVCCTGCGVKVKGDTTHTLQGEATVKVVIGVDVSICQDLEPEAKAECIQSLLDLAKAAAESKDQEQTGFSGI